MDKLILFGAGGHGKVVKDIAASHKGLSVYAILDDAFEGTMIRDGIIYAHTSFLENLNNSEIETYRFSIAVGNNATRKKMFERFSIPLEHYTILIHPSAVVSPSAKIGYGTVIMPHAVINADAVLKNHCIVNSGAVVEHDNLLGDYVHVSPNASLCGTVSIGEGTHIGAGAVVIPGKQVGSWSTIGAGAVVTTDIEDHKTAVGIPARMI